MGTRAHSYTLNTNTPTHSTHVHTATMALSVLSSSSAVTARRAMSSSASSSSAPRRAASRMVEQWSLKKTLKEKSLGDISTNISEGVRFGGFTAPNERFVARMSMLVNAPKSLEFMKPGSWRDAFGLNPEGTPLFGFTENNELFIGRLAAMGFLGTT